MRELKALQYRGLECGKIDMIETLIPPVILFTSFYLSTYGLSSTIVFLGIVMPSVYCILHHFIFKHKVPATRFYVSWTISSYLLLILIFESIVAAYLEITLWENVILLVLAMTSLLTMFVTRRISKMSMDHPEQVIVYVPWIASNVTSSSLRMYVVSLAFAIAALLFGSYLNLSTICHTHSVFVSILELLIPDDCSEVYFDLSLSLTLVSALYAGALSMCLLYLTISICVRDYHYSPVSSNSN